LAGVLLVEERFRDRRRGPERALGAGAGEGSPGREPERAGYFVLVRSGWKPRAVLVRSVSLNRDRSIVTSAATPGETKKNSWSSVL
jgi:hypothetical protein